MRQCGRYSGELGVDSLRNRARIGMILLCDGHNHSRLCPDRSHTDPRQATGRFDSGNVAECDGTAVVGSHHSHCKLITIGRVYICLNDIFVSIIIHNASAGIGIDALGCGSDIGHTDTIRLHPVGIELYLILGCVSADYTHLRDAAESKNPRLDRALGKPAKLKHRRAVGRETYDHHFSKNR